ncbi:hypothetical protein ACS0TY_027547 [Phlomoides rotata]
MAQNSHTYAFFLIALIMFATAKPLAHAQLGGIIGGSIGSIPGIIGGITGGLPIPINNIPSTLLNNLIVQGLNISGILCCTPTGNCPGGPPLSGVLVNISCSGPLAGGSLIIGQGRTDLNGVFNISVTNIANYLANPLPVLPCNITINPDQAICPILSNVDGILGTVLTTVLTPISIVLNQVIAGLILNLPVGLYVRIN